MLKIQVRDVDRIRITKVYASCPGWPSGRVITHKSTPGKHKHMLFPTSLQLPTYNGSSAGQLAGPVHDNGQHLTTQSGRYHSVSGTINLRLQVCYGLLAARPGYWACWVANLCIVAECTGFYCVRTDPVFVDLLRRPGIDSQPCGLV